MTTQPLHRLPDPVAGDIKRPNLELVGHPSAVTLRLHAQRFVQALVEIVEGDRSPTQLLRWSLPRVYEDVARRTAYQHRVRRAAPAPRARARVVSVRVCQPCSGVAEVAAHVRYGPRSQAVAARMERIGDHWVCTAVDWG